jgi:hypothetical protein
MEILILVHQLNISVLHWANLGTHGRINLFMNHLMLGAPKILTRIVLGLGVVAGNAKLSVLLLGHIFEFGHTGQFCLFVPLIKPPPFLSSNSAIIIKLSLLNHLRINDVPSLIPLSTSCETHTDPIGLSFHGN